MQCPQDSKDGDIEILHPEGSVDSNSDCFLKTGTDGLSLLTECQGGDDGADIEFSSEAKLLCVFQVMLLTGFLICDGFGFLP